MGLRLKGQRVTPEEVIKGFPNSPEGKLGIARFREQCFLRGILLNGQLVTADSVVKDFPDTSEGQLGLARFKEKCCLSGLLLNGQPVTPDAVARAFPKSQEGKLGLVRFKELCCLRGLLLNGRKIRQDAVIKAYERGNWLLERAIFYAQLALNASEVNGNTLDNQIVLAAYDKAPGNHSSRQAEYLMQRLKQPQWYDEANEDQETIQRAWQILNSVPAKDLQKRLKCVLKFMAMQYELTIDHRRVSAEQVLQSIKTLRCSFQNSRLHFFFLAHCCITGRPVNGRQVHKNQVLESLQSFPRGSNLRHALGCWFEQYSSAANLMDELLIRQEHAIAPGRSNYNRRGYAAPASPAPSAVNPGRAAPYPVQLKEYLKETENTSAAVTVNAAQTLKHGSTERPATGRPECSDNQVPMLNGLTLKALEIIQEINHSYTNPPILITGSYARFLQKHCLSFNDIDIICTTEVSAETLVEKLRALNTDKDSDIPQGIVIWRVPGCQAIKLPNAYNIDLKDGDLGMKAMGLQVNIDDRVTDAKAAAIQVSGVDRPVWCLPFTEETRLLNNTLEYLAENLDPLTEQLQNGAVFPIPRTILFNHPESPNERIYGLFMRSLLTLNKARQFIALHSAAPPKEPDDLTNLLQEQQRLHALTENLQMKLRNHVRRRDFEHRVNGLLLTNPPVNNYQIKGRDFIKALIAMIGPANSTS